MYLLEGLEIWIRIFWIGFAAIAVLSIISVWYYDRKKCSKCLNLDLKYFQNEDGLKMRVCNYCRKSQFFVRKEGRWQDSLSNSKQ